MKGNDGGPVIVPGNIKESILFEVITLPPDDDMIMPPKGDPLAADQIEMFRRWILEGASEKPSGKVVAASAPEDGESTDSRDSGVIHKAPPKKKAVFRKGSFFAHVPVPLGVSPEEALAKSQGSVPKPGEPIDFDRHVLLLATYEALGAGSSDNSTSRWYWMTVGVLPGTTQKLIQFLQNFFRYGMLQFLGFLMDFTPIKTQGFNQKSFQ